MQPADFIALRRVAARNPSPLGLAGLTPWCCEYRPLDGVRRGITLYGADPQQVYEDNLDALPGLVIVGVLHKVMDA